MVRPSTNRLRCGQPVLSLGRLATSGDPDESNYVVEFLRDDEILTVPEWLDPADYSDVRTATGFEYTKHR